LTTHYVDNKQLYAVIVEYKNQFELAELHNQDPPPIPNYVGECILQIAKRLSTKPNFINYSYREEMISDGIENCISYFNNFDPSKSDNPFAYFTQIIYYAFLRRIQKEKKQVYIKHKTAENSMVFNELVEMDENDLPFAVSDFDSENVSDFIKAFEDNMNKKKIKRRKGLEVFLEEEEAPDEDSFTR
jgi:DNA-directed RNA polymerase specialized sigma24 family protein